jgi:hypothetical protein
MTPTTGTYGLTLTAAQAEHLLRLVSIAELALAEHYRTGWLPGGSGDATLMTRYVEAMRGAPSLETPMRELREWARKQG